MVEPSDELQVVFEKAIKDAKKLRHEYVTLEHLFFAMLCSDNFVKVLDGYGCKVDSMKEELNDHLQNKLDEIKIGDEIKNYKPKKTQTVERVMNRAFTQTLFSGRAHIDTTDVFLSLLNEAKSFSTYLATKSGVEKDKFSEYINHEYITTLEDEELAGHAQRALKAFTTNLNAQVESGNIDLSLIHI